MTARCHRTEGEMEDITVKVDNRFKGAHDVWIVVGCFVLPGTFSSFLHVPLIGK